MKNVLFFTLILLFVSCNTNDEANYIAPESQSVNAIQLRADSNFGNILTDANGNTLYLFAPDVKGDANCLNGCADVWPAFFTETISVDNGLDISDFATITRTDGENQITYKGWPLYTFANDAQAGDVNGDGAGGVWFVSKPDYSIMLVRSQLVGLDTNGTYTNLNSSYEPGDEQTFYLTDDRGNTLYRFSYDTHATNNFTNSDFSNNPVWPIFNTDIQSLPSALNPNDFSEMDFFNQTQLTYKGWPVYYFGGDDERGDNYGVGYPTAGVWPILNLDTETAPGDEESSAQDFYTNSSTGGSGISN